MTQLEALLASLVSPQFVTGLDDDIARLVASGDEQALVAYLEREMQKTGYSTNAGRSALEIARRLKEKAHPVRNAPRRCGLPCAGRVPVARRAARQCFRGPFRFR
ncbi:hypothetical protein ACOJBM_22305 [Rhizobium beringeri]